MAGASMRGDFRRFQAFIGKFEALQTDAFRRRMNRQLANESLELALEGFEKSIDPYGKRWKNPKHRRGQPLLDTGRLRASIKPKGTPESFELKTNTVYAAPHQYGSPSQNIPQRQFLPDGSMGFGGRWRKALFAIVHDEISNALTRRK